MKCSNCGHENDADAEFCEKCGSNLNKSSVPTSTKMLIIVAIAICAVVGMGASAYIMTASHVSPVIATNNSSNSTVSTNNSNSGTSNINSGNGSNNSLNTNSENSINNSNSGVQNNNNQSTI
jgi:hypothetical protein